MHRGDLSPRSVAHWESLLNTRLYIIMYNQQVSYCPSRVLPPPVACWCCDRRRQRRCCRNHLQWLADAEYAQWPSMRLDPPSQRQAEAEC